MINLIKSWYRRYVLGYIPLDEAVIIMQKHLNLTDKEAEEFMIKQLKSGSIKCYGTKVKGNGTTKN